MRQPQTSKRIQIPSEKKRKKKKQLWQSRKSGSIYSNYLKNRKTKELKT